MTAFVLVTATFKDKDKFQEYAKLAGPTLASHGGEPVLRGKFVKVIAGEANPHEFSVALKFPDLAAIDAWYGSTEYQAIIPVRDAGADVNFTVYETPE